MRQAGLVSRHSPSRCSGCRQRRGCHRSQMFITATANYFHSSSTLGWFLNLFTSSQAGSGLSLPAEGGCDGKQLTWAEALEQALLSADLVVWWFLARVCPFSAHSRTISSQHTPPQGTEYLGVWGEAKNVWFLDILALKMPIILCERNWK